MLHRLFLPAILAIPLVACSEPGPTHGADHHARISESLAALTAGGFVCFEGPPRYTDLEEACGSTLVQFTGGGDAPFVLDIPKDSLEASDWTRAVEYFAELGVQPTEVGSGASALSVLQLDLGRDVERATERTLDVFREVYRLPDGFALEVTGDRGTPGPLWPR